MSMRGSRVESTDVLICGAVPRPRKLQERLYAMPSDSLKQLRTSCGAQWQKKRWGRDNQWGWALMQCGNVPLPSCIALWLVCFQLFVKLGFGNVPHKSLGCVALFFAAAGSRVCFCWRHGRTCLAGSLSDKHSQKRRSKHAPAKSMKSSTSSSPYKLRQWQTSNIRPPENWNQWTSTHINYNLWFQKLLDCMWLYIISLYDVLCDLLLLFFPPHSTAFLWPSPRHSSRGVSSVRRDGVSGPTQGH